MSVARTLNCARCGDPVIKVVIQKTVQLYIMQTETETPVITQDVKAFHTGVINEYWCGDCFSLLLDRWSEEDAS